MTTHLADFALHQENPGVKKKVGETLRRRYTVTVTPHKPLHPAKMRKLEVAEVERVIKELRSQLLKIKVYSGAPVVLGAPSKPPVVKAAVRARESVPDPADPHAMAFDLVKRGTDWLTGEEVGRRSGVATSNPYAKASRWLKDKKVFAIELDGVKKFPAYAFEPSGAPVPALREVLQVLDGMSPFAIAAWFESTSSMLGGRRPRELLALDARAVLAAAQALREGPTHG